MFSSFAGYGAMRVFVRPAFIYASSVHLALTVPPLSGKRKLIYATFPRMYYRINVELLQELHTLLIFLQPLFLSTQKTFSPSAQTYPFNYEGPDNPAIPQEYPLNPASRQNFQKQQN